MKPMIFQMAGIAVGGAAGALARWGIASTVNRWVPDFPAGTLFINVVGSFLLGLALSMDLPPVVRVSLAVGFLGAFTTFSTFMFESHALAEAGALGRSILNLTVSLALGLIAVRAGLMLGAR